MMRQLHFDAWHCLALNRLARSADPRIAEIAAKSNKEARYHLRRSSDLIVRLGDGTEESHALVQAAADALWPYTGELFVGDAVDTEMVTCEEGFDPASLKGDWHQFLANVFDSATLRL